MDHAQTAVPPRLSRRDLWSALRLALIIGTLLNLINQGQALLSMDWQALSLWKAGLTYFVPFGVAAYSAQQAKRQCPASLIPTPASKP